MKIAAFIMLCFYGCIGYAQPEIKPPKYKFSGETYGDSLESKVREPTLNLDPDLKNYISYDIIAKARDGKTSYKESLVKIIFLDPKSQYKEGLGLRAQTIGFISVDFIRRNSYQDKYTIKYLKKTNEPDGVTYWYVIIDYNEDYDVLKVCKLKNELRYNGNRYDTYVIFSKYGTKLSPSYELIFLCDSY